MHEPLPRRFLTYRQAAAFLAIPIGSLRSMVHNKTIPHVRIGPRTVTFDVAELEQWIADRKVAVSLRRSPGSA